MPKKNKTEKTKRRAAHEKRMKKAPTVSYTKGYYRFSKVFPSVTDGGGYRDNDTIINSPAKKAADKRRLGILFVCVTILAFIAVTFAFALSDLPAAKQDEATDANRVLQTTDLTGYKAAWLGGDILTSENIGSVSAALRASGVNTVVVEFKDAAGCFYFMPSISVPAEAKAKASADASKAVKSLKSAGLTVFAAVSCLADDIYARNYRELALYTSTPNAEDDNENVLWYADSHAWLSPYSDDTAYYLNRIVSDVIQTGVDGLIFTNAFLPNIGEEAVTIPYKTDMEPAAKSAEQLSYLNNMFTCQTGVLVSAALTADAAILTTGCDHIIPDLRKADDASAAITAMTAVLSANESRADIIPLLDAENGGAAALSPEAKQQIHSVIMYSQTFTYKPENF